MDYFLFLSSFRTCIAQKMLICCTFISNGALAQSVERGANNGKVLCSSLRRTRFHFLFGLLSLFKKFEYIHCINNVILKHICNKWSTSSVGRASC